jgi:hypothetical protein
LAGEVRLELGDGQVLLDAGVVGVAAAVEAHQVVVEVRLEAEVGLNHSWPSIFCAENYRGGIFSTFSWNILHFCLDVQLWNSWILNKKTIWTLWIKHTVLGEKMKYF